MYSKLENTSKNIEKRNELLKEFDNGVNEKHCEDFKKFSINEIINNSVENVIKDIVSDIIKNRTVLTSSKNIGEIAKNCTKFFQDSGFGTFEYMQKTGRSSFKVKHSSGNNGTRFLKEFFERIFSSCLNEYSFHIIADDSQVCIIFR